MAAMPTRPDSPRQPSLFDAPDDDAPASAAILLATAITGNISKANAPTPLAMVPIAAMNQPAAWVTRDGASSAWLMNAWVAAVVANTRNGSICARLA